MLKSDYFRSLPVSADRFKYIGKRLISKMQIQSLLAVSTTIILSWQYVNRCPKTLNANIVQWWASSAVHHPIYTDSRKFLCPTCMATWVMYNIFSQVHSRVCEQSAGATCCYHWSAFWPSHKMARQCSSFFGDLADVPVLRLRSGYVRYFLISYTVWPGMISMGISCVSWFCCPLV